MHWHYTLADRLLRILADGRIKRARTMVSTTERAAVWFSSRPTWEPTATKLYAAPGQEPRKATIEEMTTKCGPLVRLAVDTSVARYSWLDHRRIGQLDARMADALEAAALKCGGDPADWRVSYHDVLISQITTIEASNDGETWRIEVY